MSFVFRPYQARTVDAARWHVQHNNRRVLIVGPTGSGKMVLVAGITQLARQGFDARVLFLAHRIELIDQAVEQLGNFGIHDVGVIRAQDDRTRADAPVQVASYDTIVNRKLPPADVVFSDEAHHDAADRRRELLAKYDKANIIGLTATPCRLDGQPFKGVYDALVISATYAELIAHGFIVAPVCYSTEAVLDVSQVNVYGGDYESHGLEVVLDQSHVVGDIVKEWQEHAEGRPTVVFACTVKHSLSIVKRFLDAGIRAEHLDASVGEDARRACLRRLKDGHAQVVSNVGILCLDEETEILTSVGWVGIDAMTDSHHVANWTEEKVTFERPLEVVRRLRYEDEGMVSLRSSRLSIRVTETHRMLYRTTKTGPFLKTSALNLTGRAVQLPVSGKADPLEIGVAQPAIPKMSRSKAISHTAFNLRSREGMSQQRSVVEATRRVDRVRSLRYKQPTELSIDECRLIGFWIGDGSVATLKRGGREYTLSQSKVYPDIIAWIDAVLAACAIDVVRREPTYGTVPHVRWSLPRGTGSGSQERRGVFSIEPFLLKAANPLWWGLNEKQFDALVEGFWKADGDHLAGSLPTGRALVIHNHNEAILSLLQAVASVRGYRARVRSRCRPQQAHHHQMYSLVLRKTKSFHVGTARLEHEAMWQPERVWCVRTRTKNIVTRRRGTVVVMGNTEGWDAPWCKCIIMARPTLSLSLFMQIVGRGLRPWNDVKPILLDHSGNLDRHGLPHEDRVWSLFDAPRLKAKSPYRTCPKCYAYVLRNPCELCGHFATPEERQIREKLAASRLVERGAEDVRRVFFVAALAKAKAKGYRPGYASAKYKEKFGEFPPWSWSQEAKQAMDPQWAARIERQSAEREHWKRINEGSITIDVPEAEEERPEDDMTNEIDQSEIPF